MSAGIRLANAAWHRSWYRDSSVRCARLLRMSADRIMFARRASGSGESQDQNKRLFRPRPEFADHRFVASSDEVAKDEREDDRVVELPGDRNEVWDEIERQGEIRDERDQQELTTPWHARIACESRHEHDAVGDERGKCTCVLTATADYEPGEE